MSGVLMCPIQYQLREQFERTHEHYNNTFYVLVSTMDVEEASMHVRGLYQACMTAKKALQDHKGEHGC
jgi:hypothetical protein